MAVTLSVTYERTGYSNANLTSTVKFWVKASWTYGSYNKDSRPGTITIDGTKYTFSSSFNSGQSSSGTVTLHYRTVTLKHKADGTKTFTVSATFDTDVSSGNIKTSRTITLPKLTPPPKTYKITFNANGGSGGPGSQTATEGKALTISSTKPTRTGYTFSKWNTNSDGSGTTYNPGGSYTFKAADTLYAIWTINKYTISYDANGGSGAPSAQTKTYGTALTLSSTKPTRSGYTFLGWSTSKTATVQTYNSGASYTTNAGATLYAVWEVIPYVKPRITKLNVFRCNNDNTPSDSGTYVNVSFNWETDETASSYKIDYKKQTASTWSAGLSAQSITGKSGTVTNKIFGGGSIDLQNTYDIRISVTDAKGTSESATTVESEVYIIDIRNGGTGVAFGKVAEAADYLDVGYKGRFQSTVQFLDTVRFAGKVKTDDHIEKTFGGGTWISGRDNATVRNLGATSGSWFPLTTTKTPLGSWEMGSLGEYFYLSYCTDADYAAGNNKNVRITFNPNGAISSNMFKVLNDDRTASSNLSYNNGLELTGGIATPNNSYFRSYFTDKPERIGIYGIATNNHVVAGPPKGEGYGLVLRGDFVRLQSSSGTNVSSDGNLKKNIRDIDEKYINFFNELKPISYTYIRGESGRTHIGFVAQDVEDALNNSELTTKEFGGICINDTAYCEEDPGLDDNYLESRGINKIYTLRYEEFIALNTKMIQKCMKKIDELENRIKELEGEKL